MNYFFSILLVGFILLGIDWRSLDWNLVSQYLVEIPSVLKGLLASF